MTLLDATACENMLKSQILPGHVLEPRILAALTEVSREVFVPDAYKGAAYLDDEIPLTSARTLMSPLTFARMLTHAAIASHETVLDVGCAAGYSAMVIGKLARKVVALEEDRELAAKARTLLGGAPNIEFAETSLTLGKSDRAPYDAILIEGAIEMLPQPLADQLAEGGRLIAVEHNGEWQVGASGLGRLVEYRKVRGQLYKTTLQDASMRLLGAFRKPAIFSL